MPALAPVSWNFTGTVLPSLKMELPSVLIGCRMPDQACGNRDLELFGAGVAGLVRGRAGHRRRPSGNVEPDAGLHVVGTEPSTASIAMTPE